MARKTVDVTITLYPDEKKAVDARAKKSGASRSIIMQRCVRLGFGLDDDINNGKLK